MLRAPWLLLAALIAFVSLASPALGQAAPAYIALGDSLAFGIGAAQPEEGGYVARAHAALLASDRYRERGLELINLGVPGATSADLLLPGGQLETALAEIAARRETPSPYDDVEIISIDIGGNDLIQLSSYTPCLSDPLGLECQQRFNQMLDELATNLAEILRRLREAAPLAKIVVLELYNPYSGTGTSPESTADIAILRVNRTIGAVVGRPELRAELAPVFQLFQGRGREWIAVDGLHPNDEGHAALAEALLATLEGREPVPPGQTFLDDLIPSAGTPAPEPGEGAARQETPAGGGANAALLLGIAVPAAFAAGAIISGAYFVARGRR